jgi:hypothetical protein
LNNTTKNYLFLFNICGVVVISTTEGALGDVMYCGDFFTEKGGICSPYSCFLVDVGADTCSQVPNCSYKEKASKCVSNCGSFYNLVDGVCVQQLQIVQVHVH